MAIQQVLFIVGSPKLQGSTSEVLGRYVTDKLAAAGMSVTVAHSHKVLRSPSATAQFLNDFDAADLVLLSYPLYVDTLPYLVTRAFEVLYAHRAAHPVTRPQRLACIGNCGYPEAHHLHLSLAICQQFAEATHLAWYGALAMGEGTMIDGGSLDAFGPLLRNHVKALNQMAESLIRDQPVPAPATKLAGKKFFPGRLYTLAGSIQWVAKARKLGARGKMSNAPYARQAVPTAGSDD